MKKTRKATRRRKPKKQEEQIHIEDMHLNVGDKLYKNEKLYGEVTSVSDTLYFIQRNPNSSMADPFTKDRLVEAILMGQLSVNKVRY